MAALARSLGRPPVHRSLQFPFSWDSEAQGDQKQEAAAGGGARPPPPPWTWICAQSCSTVYSGLEAAGTPAAGRPPPHKDERGGREAPDCSRGGVAKATPAGRRLGALPVALPHPRPPAPVTGGKCPCDCERRQGEEAARGGEDPAGGRGRGSEGPAPPQAPRPPPGAARGARGTTTRGSPTQSALPPPRARRGPQTEGEHGRTREPRAALTSSPPAPHFPGAPHTAFSHRERPAPTRAPLRRSPQSHGSPSPTSTQTPTPTHRAAPGAGGRGARGRRAGRAAAAAAATEAAGARAAAPCRRRSVHGGRPSPRSRRCRGFSTGQRRRPRPDTPGSAPDTPRVRPPATPTPRPTSGSGPRNVLRPSWPPNPPSLCGRPAPRAPPLASCCPVAAEPPRAACVPWLPRPLRPCGRPAPAHPRTPRRPTARVGSAPAAGSAGLPRKELEP